MVTLTLSTACGSLLVRPDWAAAMLQDRAGESGGCESHGGEDAESVHDCSWMFFFDCDFSCLDNVLQAGFVECKAPEKSLDCSWALRPLYIHGMLVSRVGTPSSLLVLLILAHRFSLSLQGGAPTALGCESNRMKDCQLQNDLGQVSPILRIVINVHQALPGPLHLPCHFAPFSLVPVQVLIAVDMAGKHCAYLGRTLRAATEMQIEGSLVNADFKRGTVIDQVNIVMLDLDFAKRKTISKAQRCLQNPETPTKDGHAAPPIRSRKSSQSVNPSHVAANHFRV